MAKSGSRSARPQGRTATLWWWVVVVMVVAGGSAGQAMTKDKQFKDDVDLQDPETGQEFQLHSEGVVAQLVDLDMIPEVTRVACKGDRLILKMTDTTPAQSWRKGQVVLGGLTWGCNATHHNGFHSQAIYVKLTKISFPLDFEVALHHEQAGPFDIVEEARIHFHYDPGKKTHPTLSQTSLVEKKRRFRRSLSNLASNILNNIDWHANFSATIPFNIGSDQSNSSAQGNASSAEDDPSENVNGSEPMTLALHKSWSQKNMTVTRGLRAKEVKDDFVLNLDKLHGYSELSYTFDLVIKNIDRVPHIVKYVNQYDLQSHLEADATASFQREMGVTYNVTLDHSPMEELLRVPLIKPRGGNPPLPPVYLVVSYSAVSAVTMSAYSAGLASVSTGFNSSGYVTASQQFDLVTKVRSDATSREWSMESQEQNLRSPYRTHVDLSVYQKLFFTSALSWRYHDVDIKLSPPMEITVHPEVKVRSVSPGVSQCVNSTMSVDAHIHAGKADFTADAFGQHLWDVPLQPAMTRDLHLIDGHLGQGCDARCHGPSHLITEPLNTTQQITPFGRKDPEFSRLQAFSGDQVHFYDGAANATWCGQPGTSCHRCSQHATDTSSDMTCAARLMTSRLAAALALLVDFVTVEWPDKPVMVLEGWDEANSEHPSGLHDDQSLYKVGRALTLALLDPQDLQPILDTSVSERLGQLSVCAGFDLVQSLDSGSRLQVAVAEDGWTPADPEREEQRTRFWAGMDSMDVSTLSPKCQSAPSLSEGDIWPQQSSDPALRCGPVERPLHRGDRTHMATLIHWNHSDVSMAFEVEGQATNWCGHPSRPCRDQCITSSDDLEPWSWCSTRMMTPRLAIRLRKLQKLAEERNIEIRVLQAFTETSENQTITTSLYHEGRAVKLTTVPTEKLSDLASLAVCAGFDFVSFTSSAYMEAFVKVQTGYQTVLTKYFEGAARAMVFPVGTDDQEYSYPVYLKGENTLPMLVDGGFPPDTLISEHVRLRDVMSSDRRYFRLDLSLLECIEQAGADFDGKIEIIQDSVYRTRSANVRRNIDLRHPQEVWRFQSGQAMEVRPVGTISSERLFALATSILRECPVLVREQMRAVGLGCHDDRVYVDLRPLVAGHERVYVMVWEEGKTDYYQHVMDLQKNMIEGGPVVQSVPAIACKGHQLDPGLEFLSFQMGQNSNCQVEGQAAFCIASLKYRNQRADDLQKLLTSAAGHGRLPRYELIHDIRACLVQLCGGCAGVGAVFDSKVRACSRLVHKYIERAASPLPDLTNVTAFFNTHTRLSTVYGLACRADSVCVENIPVYSLFVPTVTARYYPDLNKSLERPLFAADINPTPLLELVAQEMAFRAKGKVTVYIVKESDMNALRNVLKVLMLYNKNVSLVEFHVAAAIDSDLVTSSIQRKLEAWSGLGCPHYSRFALAPFIVVTLDIKRHRRSAEQSIPRNKVMTQIYNWEQEWLDKMF